MKELSGSPHRKGCKATLAESGKSTTRMVVPKTTLPSVKIVGIQTKHRQTLGMH
jgi:hypothetical protein